MQLETPMFGKSISDGGEFVILKSEQDLVIAGYASVDVVDKQNDKITLPAIKEAANKFMKDDRYRNVMITHSNVQVGEVVNQWSDSNGKVLKTGVDDTGFFVVIKLRSDIEKAKEVARDIRRGNLRSFSIGGQAISKTNRYDADVGSYKEIDKLELHEITICEEGINPEAKFNIVKEDKKMSEEIEKALAEFNDVMGELKGHLNTVKKEDEEEVESMELMGDEEMMDEEMMDEEMAEEDIEMGDYSEEEEPVAKTGDVVDALDYDTFIEQKGEEVTTLDLSEENLAKAYAQFKAEKEEARAYDLIKEQFESRYNSELKVEADAIAKSQFDSQGEISELKNELAELRKSMETTTIAKSADSITESTTIDVDVANMSWAEAHEFANNMRV
tara:strand:+ start:1732 stop:2895 length:1164 start_codon:yes stop_codon:yes gene_type:complete